MPGTIRGDFGLETQFNLVHGSDSHESAEREIALWFPGALTPAGAGPRTPANRSLVLGLRGGMGYWPRVNVVIPAANTRMKTLTRRDHRYRDAAPTVPAVIQPRHRVWFSDFPRAARGETMTSPVSHPGS